MTFMLRKPSVFDQDVKMQKYIQEGRAKILKGDATIRTDIQKALLEARLDGKLDAVLFSVGMIYPFLFSEQIVKSNGVLGGIPSLKLKGFILDPPNLCSSSLYNVLVSYPDATPTSSQPKLIVISSNGLTKASHRTLPLLLKPLFTYGLHSPHVDKLCMERKYIILDFDGASQTCIK